MFRTDWAWTYGDRCVEMGELVRFDDELILHFRKELDF